MKLPSKSSTRRQCGIPVNVRGKAILRKRSILLTNAQRHVLKQMGVRVDKRTTEKQAVMAVKRIVNFESAYGDKSYISKWTRKRRGHKPKNLSNRQHMMNTLMYREEHGSKKATKDLAKL
jgi:hypothetical protein